MDFFLELGFLLTLVELVLDSVVSADKKIGCSPSEIIMTRLKYLKNHISSIVRAFVRKFLAKIALVGFSRFSAKTFASQAGQAVLEYVLTLVVVVTILTAGIYQFSSAFQAFATSYFGEYLQCLIEAGELPQLGNDDGGICESSFQSFSLANGRPPVDGPGSGSGSDSGGSSSGLGGGEVVDYGGSNPYAAGKPVGRGPGTSAGVGNSSDQAGVGGDSGSINPGRGGSASLRSSVVRRNGAGNDGRFGKQNKGKVPFNPTANTYTDLSSDNPSGLRQRRVLASNYDGEEQQGENVVGAATNRASSRVGSSGRDKKVPVGERRTAAVEDEKPDMSFGHFMRYLIIFCMVVALILFIGGQIQSITKSMD